MAKKQKKIRKNVVKGTAYVKASFNNTLVTVTDANGEAICWDSAGTVGFKGARRWIEANVPIRWIDGQHRRVLWGDVVDATAADQVGEPSRPSPGVRLARRTR